MDEFQLGKFSRREGIEKGKEKEKKLRTKKTAIETDEMRKEKPQKSE